MSFNEFWSRSIKSDVTNAYIDKKFINLATALTSKASKSGEEFSGDIRMGAYKITSTYTAANDSDLVNKKYSDALTTSTREACIKFHIK